MGNTVASLPARLRLLLTGRTEWLDPETGEIQVFYEDFPTSWALAGFHSMNWWWVRKFGNLNCGCIRNPVTRNIVATAMCCETHNRFYREWLDFDEDGEIVD